MRKCDKKREIKRQGAGEIKIKNEKKDREREIERGAEEQKKGNRERGKKGVKRRKK